MNNTQAEEQTDSDTPLKKSAKLAERSVDDQQLINRINTIDLSEILSRLVYMEYWDEDDAREAVVLYKQFLFLLAKYRKQFELPPSKCIDEVWHAHILYTKQYHQDTELLFGEYLHHNPLDSKEADSASRFADSFTKNTLRLFKQEFAVELKQVQTPLIIRLYNRAKLAIKHQYVTVPDRHAIV